MPELPEVETVVRELQKSLTGHKFTEIITTRSNIREEIPDLSCLEGAEIKEVERRAKYIIIRLQATGNRQKKEQSTIACQLSPLIIHLGMSGTIRIGKPEAHKKHDHVIFSLSNGREMVFNDPRRFGLVTLYNDKYFKDLGPEPLQPEFNVKYLKNALASRSCAIKLAIMDQKVVVGVGNIYASEALFRSRINPTCPANKVKNHAELIKNIQNVLSEAIISGGSTLRDYVRSSGDLGYFQHHHAVYGHDGEPCQVCSTKIKKITQGGRSTFYCAKCQKGC
jgi:formamidopyrimidine-DNA glycosylase